jgi:hypothetical protein
MTLAREIVNADSKTESDRSGACGAQPAARAQARPLRIRLIALNIKGSLPVAQDALAERGIECMTTQEMRFELDAEVMTRVVVDGDRFGPEVAYWYTEGSTAPFPPGTLLHYGGA